MFDYAQIQNQDKGRLRNDIDAQKAPNHFKGF
jgi:hypothetical protein